MAKIIFISDRPVYDKHGNSDGIAARTVGLAKALADKGHEVTVAEPKINSIESHSGIMKDTWTKKTITKFAQKKNVIIFQQFRLAPYISEKLSNCYLILDAFDPLLIEDIFRHRQKKNTNLNFAEQLDRFLKTFKRVDRILSASETQKTYYEGLLNIIGRINPITVDTNFIITTPTGIRPKPFQKKSQEFFESSFHIKKEKDDFWILSNGGLYPWFDFDTVLKAFIALVKDQRKIKMLIVGGNNPKDRISEEQYERARKRANDAGLFEKNIFFRDWVPYDACSIFLSNADLAVNVDRKSLESKYSYRTRLLDYIWSELPLATNPSDEISKKLLSHGAAIEIGRKEHEIKERVAFILKNRNYLDEIRLKLATIKKTFSWEENTKALNSYLNNLEHAKDRFDENAKNTFLSVVKSEFSAAKRTRFLFGKLLDKMHR